VHHAAEHTETAAAFRWTATATVEAAAAEPEQPFYARAGKLRQLELEAQLPLVLVLSFRL
jgi:hypothetical protein